MLFSSFLGLYVILRIRKTAFSLPSPPLGSYTKVGSRFTATIFTFTAGAKVCNKYANTTTYRHLYNLHIGCPTKAQTISYNHVQGLEEEITKTGHTLREKLFKSCKAFHMKHHWGTGFVYRKKAFRKRCLEDLGGIRLRQG
jgi:hypothetical protein